MRKQKQNYNENIFKQNRDNWNDFEKIVNKFTKIV